MGRSGGGGDALACGFLAAAMLLGWAPAAPLTPPGRGRVERIEIQSLTLPEGRALTLHRDGEPTVVRGTLRLPPDAPGRLAAVILAHGCSGVGPVQEGWAEELNRMGVAAFILDSFRGREIREVCTRQERINLASRLVDAYRALEALAGHPRVDPSRIALMGFSQGGGVVVWARHLRFQRLWMRGERDFAAYLAFYPGRCNWRLLEEEQVSDRPLRIFHGTADDWTPIGPCREYVERMRRAGKDAALIEYPGAHHAFDNPRLPAARIRADVFSSRACTVVERAEGRFAFLHRETGKLVTSGTPCSSPGATIGHDPGAHRQAIQDVRTFLEVTLKGEQ